MLIDGQFRFVKEPLVMEKLDYANLQTPGIRNITQYQRAERSPHPYMDKISIHQNVFLEIKDKSKDSDLSIIPLEINLDFLALQRVGPKSVYGVT